MKLLLILLVISLVGIACSPSSKPPKTLQFQLVNTFYLDSLAPIGMAIYQNQLWLSDGDNNRLVALDSSGQITQIIHNFERPMHLDANEQGLIVPEYGKDTISLVLATGEKASLEVGLPLDAPAGVSVLGQQMALADFYNHRVVYTLDQQQWKSLGTKGKGQGAFHYPTDVQWTTQELFVADAYNHRVQVFDHQGQYLRTIAEKDSLNAATGLHVADTLLAVTDFEQDRVLVYTTAGKRLQIIAGGLDKPTDVLFWKGKLYVLNYGNGALQCYALQ